MGAGIFVSLLNFYLSFVRVPLLRYFNPGRRVRNLSGFPVVGSAVLWISLLFVPRTNVVFWPTLVISVFDTGGIHWFLAIMAITRIRGRR